MPDIRWRGQEHQTLYNWINSGPGAKASTPQLDYWNGLKQSLADISNKLNSALLDVGANWEGVAGRSATTGLTPLQQWAEEAQSSAEVMASSAQDQADHIATARAAMPEPQQVPTGAPATWQVQDAAAAARRGDHGPAKAIAQQATDHEQQETAAADAHERAVQVMSNYQANSENNAATLGVFGSPPELRVAVRMPDGSDSVGAGYLGGHAPMAHGAGDSPRITPSGVAPDHPSAAAAGPAAVPATPATPGTSGTAASGSSGSGIAAAAAMLGGAGALRGLVGRVAPLAKGGIVGVASSGSRAGARDDERTKPSTVRNAQTAPSIDQNSRTVGEAGSMPPPRSGSAGAGAGASMDTVRGANPYLTATPSTAGGGGEPRRFAGGGEVDASNMRGGGMGTQGGFGGAPTGVSGTPATGGPGPMVPPGGGAGMGGGGFGGATDEVYEGSSYLVEADDIFDDGRMVAPPVLGGEEDQR